MPSDKNFEVALTKCWYCLKDDKIILPKQIGNKRLNDQITEANGKVVDMDPCNECQEHMKRGVIMISVADDYDPVVDQKNWDSNSAHIPLERRTPFIPQPYRTGGWVLVTDEGFSRIFNDNANESSKEIVAAAVEQALKNRWMMTPDTVWMRIGLPRFSPGHYATLRREATLWDRDGVETTVPIDTEVLVVFDTNGMVGVVVEASGLQAVVTQNALSLDGRMSTVTEDELASYRSLLIRDKEESM